LVFGSNMIMSKRSVKILGITLDSGLPMSEHVSKAVAKAINNYMASQKIRDFRPAQMRQTHTVAVVSTTHHAVSV
jgi:hypothetical protein